MDMCDIFRQHITDDEDTKVIQMCALRLFNSFASSYKLMMSGYYQNSTMIMRDILEVIFLLDIFRTDRALITKWRYADKRSRLRDFKPAKIREALDKRDGHTSSKRTEMYDMFSELASHVNMNAILMLKPKGMDARNGPFLDSTALSATLDEMGRLAVQVVKVLDGFFLSEEIKSGNQEVIKLTDTWISEFYKTNKESTPIED